MSRRKEMMKEVQPPSYLPSSTWLDWLIWLDFNTRFHAWDAVIDPDDPRGGPLAPYSLYLLYITHPIRKPCIRLARWKMLEWIMLAVILCNCVALAMETNAPGFNESMLGRQLVTANYFFIAIFTIEMIIKVIALGFIMGEHTYLRNGWNVLDFVIVLFAWLGLVPAFGSYTFMRCARVLRPLRLITQIESLRNLVVSVLLSLPMLGNVVILAIFCYAIFGIANVELFKGRMSNRCGAPDPSSFDPSNLVNGIYRNVTYIVDPNNFAESTWPCIGPMASSVTWRNVNGTPVPSVLTIGGPSSPSSNGRVCPSLPSVNPNDPNSPMGLFCVPFANPTPYGSFRHSDNILTSWLSVFQHTAPQDWSFIMYDEWDGLTWWTWPYDIFMVLICGFLIQNLTLAILFLNFTKNYRRIKHEKDLKRVKSDSLYNSFASSSREFMKNSSLIKDERRSPQSRPLPVKPKGRQSCLGKYWESLRDFCFEVQESRSFKAATTAAIVCNIFVLALVWFPNYPSAVNRAVNNLNYAFTMIFVLEMVIKLLGLGWLRYISDNYNAFDCAITTVGVVVMTLELKGIQNTGLTSLRALRLLLLFRLANSWKSMNRMIQVMIISIKSVAWLTVLLILFIFMAAVLGVFIFGYKMDSCPVDGSQQLCPPGLTWRECPDHFDCYVPCSPSEVFTWISVSGSPYNGQAYCEAFPRKGLNSLSPPPPPPPSSSSSSSPPSPPPSPFLITEYAYSIESWMMNETTQYWAQVGKPMSPLFSQNPSYDYFYQAFLAIFVLLTQDNWAENCHWLMQMTNPWAALFIIIIIVLGVFVLLNLFLAVLIANLDDSNGIGEEEADATTTTQAAGSGNSNHPTRQAMATSAQPASPPAPLTADTPFATSQREHETGGGANSAPSAFAAISIAAGGDTPTSPPPPLPPPPPPPPSSPPTITSPSKPRTRTKLPPLAARPVLPPVRVAPLPVPPPEVPSTFPISSSEASTSEEDRVHSKRDAGGGKGGDNGFFGTRSNKIVPINGNLTGDETNGSELGNGQDRMISSHQRNETNGNASGNGHDRNDHPISSHQRNESRRPLLEEEVEDASREGSRGWLRRMWERDASLLVFGPNNPLRAFLHRLVDYPQFEYTMLIVILLSCVELCVDDSTVQKGTIKFQVLFVLNCIFAAIFCIEVIVKVIATGLLFNGPESFLRSGWNILDVAIAAVSVAIVILQATSNSSNIVWLRAIRSLRALRPVRFARRMEGFNVVCIAIGHALPIVSEVTLIGFAFYFVFAVTAVDIMAGTFQFCASSSNPSPVNGILDPYYFVPKGFNINKTWCESGGTGDVNVTTSYYHSSLNLAQPFPSYTMTTQWGSNGILPRFDNVVMALWVLFQIASLENWNNIMYFAMWTTGVDSQPILYGFTDISIFFVFFIVSGVWLILNMVIGVSINAFNRMREKNGRFAFLTVKQQEWLLLQRILLFSKPKTKYKKPENPIGAFCFNICMNERFNIVMIAIIISNTLIMCLDYQGMSSRLNLVLIISNIIFTVIYVAEMLMRWLAMGLVPYFKDGWCQFDFFVIVVSILGVILDYVTSSSVTIFTVLRLMRVLRIVKVVPRARGLRMMLVTIWWSLPALGNVASVLFIVLFIYSIIGINIFGHVMSNQQYLDEHANFQTFPRAILMLLRFSTGENWNSVMYNTMIQEQCILVTQTVNVTLDGNTTTIWSGTYLDSVADSATLALIPLSQQMDQCTPNAAVTAIYFCSYLMLVIFLLLQLIISVLIENIDNLSKMEEMEVSYRHVDSFVREWEEIDQTGSGFIKASEVTSLLMRVEPTLGVRGLRHGLLAVSEIIRGLELPLRRNNEVYFFECLHALAGRVAAAALPQEDEFELHGQVVARMPKDEEKSNLMLRHWYAADHVKASIRGFLIRKKLWQRFEEREREPSTKRT